MSEWAARRFWKAVSIRPEGSGYEVRLDDRQLRTPGKVPLILPTEALAQAVADEWAAQEGRIQPLTMPLTRAANSTVERVMPQFSAVVDMLAEYGGTDLLSYRATEPHALVALQAEAWDPLLEWAAQELGSTLRVTSGVIPIAQDPQQIDRLRSVLAALDPFGLTAAHDLITLPGSLILGLAVLKGRLDARTAHALSRLDEEFQADRWGRDAEAQQAADARLDAMRQAERLWHLSRAD